MESENRIRGFKGSRIQVNNKELGHTFLHTGLRDGVVTMFLSFHESEARHGIQD
jgi:hypothetical protein